MRRVNVQVVAEIKASREDIFRKRPFQDISLVRTYNVWQIAGVQFMSTILRYLGLL